MVGNIDFIIVGCPRSGTTLLSRILTNHRNIIVPDETGFFYYAYGMLKRFRRITNEEVYNQIFQTADLSSLPFEHAHSEAALLNRFVSHYKNKHGKAIFGEKTPRHWYLLDFILERFPQTKVIFMVRNAVSVVNSYRKYRQNWFPFFSAPTFLSLDTLLPAVVWKMAIKRYKTLKNSNRILLVRYEDLVRSPVECLTDVCSFLNVVFEPQMLSYYEKTDISLLTRRSEKNRLAHANLSKPINMERVASREHLSEEEVTRISYLLRKELREFGYEEKPEATSLVDDMLFLIAHLYYYSSLLKLYTKDATVYFFTRIFPR